MTSKKKILIFFLATSIFVWISNIATAKHGLGTTLTKQISTEGRSGLDLLIIELYNNDRLLLAIITTITMGMLGLIISYITDVILNLLGIKTSKIKHEE